MTRLVLANCAVSGNFFSRERECIAELNVIGVYSKASWNTLEFSWHLSWRSSEPSTAGCFQQDLPQHGHITRSGMDGHQQSGCLCRPQYLLQESLRSVLSQLCLLPETRRHWLSLRQATIWHLTLNATVCCSVSGSSS